MGEGGGGDNLNDGGALAGGGFLRTVCNSRTDEANPSITGLKRETVSSADECN
jgi:hypothetical protein